MIFITPTRLLAMALLMTAVACAQEPAPQPEPVEAAALGDSCGPSSPCASPLLCLDGLCVERALPPDAVPEQPDVWTPFDIGPGTPDLVTTDAPVDGIEDTAADGLGDAPDGALDGSTEVDDVSDDASPDGLSTDTVQDSDPDDAVETQLILIKNDSVEAGAGTTFFIMGEGEAWVAELSTPSTGDLRFVEVFMADVTAPKSCGRFRVALWTPDKFGILPAEPSFVEEVDHQLIGGEASQMLTLEFDASIPEGEFRIGLVQNGPCTPETAMPALMTDASGEVADSWLWIPLDGTPPWVPASVFGVDGRWAIRVIIEVPKPPDP